MTNLPSSQELRVPQFCEGKQKTFLGGHALPHGFPIRTQVLLAEQNLEHNMQHLYLSE